MRHLLQMALFPWTRPRKGRSRRRATPGAAAAPRDALRLEILEPRVLLHGAPVADVPDDPWDEDMLAAFGVRPDPLVAMVRRMDASAEVMATAPADDKEEPLTAEDSSSSSQVQPLVHCPGKPGLYGHHNLDLTTPSVIGIGETVNLMVTIGISSSEDVTVTFGPSEYFDGNNTVVIPAGETQAALTTAPITDPAFITFTAEAPGYGPAKDCDGNIIYDNSGQDADGMTSNKEYTAAVGIGNLTWEAHAGNDPLNSNDHPDAPGGQRIFPGKKDPTETDEQADDRRLVDVIAQLEPILQDTPDQIWDYDIEEWVEDNDPWMLEGVPVEAHFREFDVDDPSSDEDPIDPDDETTADGGSTGHDNRGVGGGFPDGWAIKPNDDSDSNDNTARATFEVSMQPGDNFRVAAAGSDHNYPDEMSRLTASRDAALDPDWTPDLYVPFDGQPKKLEDPGNPDFHGALTEPLTVWRKLHVEADSMGAVSGNYKEGEADTDDAIQSVTYHAGENWTHIDVGVTDLDFNRFENGWITINGTDYSIIANGNSSFSVAGEVTAQAGDGWWAHDDDDDTLLPDLPDLTLLDEIFDEAYILPVNDAPGTGDQDIPFELNLGVDQTSKDDILDIVDGPMDQSTGIRSGGSRGSAGAEGPAYWVVYVLGAYQGGKWQDYDPNESGAVLFGRAIEDQIAVIFTETIRDRAADAGEDFVNFMRQTIAHEIGHQLLDRDDEHTPDTIMQGGDQGGLPVPYAQVVFSDEDLDEIRRINWPGGPS